MNTNKRMDEGWIGECDNRKLNMDTQDAQDYQGGALLQGKLTSAMTRCGMADAQE